jgi:hypothetical protein
MATKRSCRSLIPGLASHLTNKHAFLSASTSWTGASGGDMVAWA